jgi:hypothetical protein
MRDMTLPTTRPDEARPRFARSEVCRTAPHSLLPILDHNEVSHRPVGRPPLGSRAQASEDPSERRQAPAAERQQLQRPAGRWLLLREAIRYRLRAARSARSEGAASRPALLLARYSARIAPETRKARKAERRAPAFARVRALACRSRARLLRTSTERPPRTEARALSLREAALRRDARVHAVEHTAQSAGTRGSGSTTSAGGA